MPKDEDIFTEGMAVGDDGFIKRIPQAIRGTFTDQQIAAINQAFQRASHNVDIRFTLPLPWGRRYFVLLSGNERRSPERRRLERKLHPLSTVAKVATILIIGCLFGFLVVNILQIWSEVTSILR